MVQGESRTAAAVIVAAPLKATVVRWQGLFWQSSARARELGLKMVIVPRRPAASQLPEGWIARVRRHRRESAG